MSTAANQSDDARTSEETVAFVRRRREVTKRMTRKQTELRLEALEALPGVRSPTAGEPCRSPAAG